VFADLSPLDRPALSLATVVGQAAAMTRVDRKYFVPLAAARVLLADLGEEWGLLAIGSRSTTHYRSTYFDTPDLRTARAHVQGRRRRWKARSRLYVEDRLCRVEVKVRNGRGQTVKTVADSTTDSYGMLTHHDRAFVNRTLAEHAIRVDGERLHPSMEVVYERMTLARTSANPARMTIDSGVSCHLAGQQVWLDEEHVLVETKGGRRPSDADRLLARLGARPRSFSKYTAAASMLRADIPDNDVRRLRGRLLHAGADDTLDQIRLVAVSLDTDGRVTYANDHLLELISLKIRTIPNVESTETFMYLKLQKQTYSWGVR